MQAQGSNRAARSRWLQALLFALFLLIGLAIAAQLRGQRALSRVRLMTSSTDQAAVISGLLDSNRELREEVEQLQSSLAALGRQGGALPVLMDELNRVKILNGSAQASGPGVLVRIDGPSSVADLQDLINELRDAGAEAIAVNDVRLNVATVAIATPEGIVLDQNLIQRPFVLVAIGDPQAMHSALDRPGGLVALLRAAHPGSIIEVTQTSRLTLPVTARSLTTEYVAAVR